MPDQMTAPSAGNNDSRLRAIFNRGSNQPDTSVETTSDTPLPKLGENPTQTSQPQQAMVEPALKSTQPWYRRRWGKIGLGVAVFLLVFLGVTGAIAAYTMSVVTQLRTEAEMAQATGMAAYANFKAQNLPAAEAELKKLNDQVAQIETTYGRLGFYKYVPVASAYYSDGQHGLNAAQAGLSASLKSVEAITPFAADLGFTGEGTFEGGTAENRVKLILQTLEKITPQLDAISGDLQTAQSEIDQINPNRYPATFRGREVRSNIVQAQEGIANANTLLSDYRPIIENLPSIAGSDGERKKYLILFQNDGELRPTGGFLTAYAVIFIEDGVVTPEKSDDIYELDKKFRERLPIPEALDRFLTTERYWNLRDMNTSPDFKESMDQFYEYYDGLPGEPENIDGIIAVDTHMLTDLVRIVGPIEVPGYGTFTAENDPRCDCPQIIYALSEIITKPTPYIRENRKGILGPLMQAVLQRIYQSPRVFMGELFQAGLDNADGRHLQAYFFDENHQKSAEAINMAGRLDRSDKAQDFFALVNANLGGAKSYFFIDYDIKQTIEAPQNGQLQKTVEITYKNNRRGDNCNLEAGQLCLNSTLRDWTRIYVPAGAQLSDAQGFLEEPKTSEVEVAGTKFTVFEGYFTLEPNSQSKLRLTYTVPYSDQETYTLEMWKQGGVDPIPVIMDVTGGQEELVLEKDTIFSAEF